MRRMEVLEFEFVGEFPRGLLASMRRERTLVFRVDEEVEAAVVGAARVERRQLSDWLRSAAVAYARETFVQAGLPDPLAVADLALVPVEPRGPRKYVKRDAARWGSAAVGGGAAGAVGSEAGGGESGEGLEGEPDSPDGGGSSVPDVREDLRMEEGGQEAISGGEIDGE